MNEYIQDYLAEYENFLTRQDIKVDPISDPLYNADEFLYSNSDIHSYYAQGKGMKIDDNVDFYEIIKIIKDYTDKHLYLKNLTWKVDQKNGRIVFVFEMDQQDASDNLFFASIQQYFHQMLNNISRKFMKKFDMNFEMIETEPHKQQLRIILQQGN
jgi:hypothetical protein